MTEAIADLKEELIEVTENNPDLNDMEKKLFNIAKKLNGHIQGNGSSIALKKKAQECFDKIEIECQKS